MAGEDRGGGSARGSGAAVTLWAGADSLPVEVRRVIETRAAREARRSGGLRLVYVGARAFRVSPPAEFILVDAGAGAADDRILSEALPGDLAVTRDIPLAERLAEKGILVLNDRGQAFTADTARERRSLRDRAQELRELGLAPESPRARTRGPRELKAFADAFDRVLTRALAAQLPMRAAAQPAGRPGQVPPGAECPDAAPGD